MEPGGWTGGSSTERHRHMGSLGLPRSRRGHFNRLPAGEADTHLDSAKLGSEFTRLHSLQTRGSDPGQCARRRQLDTLNRDSNCD